MPDVERLLNAIDAHEEYSYGSESDSELSGERAEAIDLYLGKNLLPAPAGRSQVVDRSVYETIQWILPSLCRIFANGDDVVSIPPIGPEDEQGAKQEAEYLNWVLTQQNPWFDTFLTWATDALMTRNAYVMAYVDKSRIAEVERYEAQTAEGLALLTQDKGVEVIESREYPDPDYQPQPVVGPDGQPMLDEMGQPVIAPPTMLYDVTIRRVDERKKVCVKALPPERVKVSHHTPSFRVGSECPYLEYWQLTTLSDLRNDGFDVPDDLPDDAWDDTEEDNARDLYDETRDAENMLDPSQRRVKARYIWIRHDYDEDGIAELLYVVRVGREVLHMEEVSTIPVASIVPSPLPHRHVGISITDIVGDIQLIKTAILRQGLDNLYLSNNPQKVVNQNLVNLDDVLTSVPGGIVRTDDVNQIRYEIPPFVFPQAMEGLEYMDQIRENRTGTNRYFTGIDQNALNKTATGIQQLSTMAAQRVEQIARVFASGVEDLARIMHELIIKSGHRQEVVRLRGNWVEIDPATWRRRTDFKIAVGFGSGNKDAMVSRLMLLNQKQLEAIQLGLPVVEPQNVYETLMELVKASDFSSPDRFFTDPGTVEPKPQPPDPNMLKIELEGKKAAVDAELEQEKLRLDDKKIDADALIKKYQIDKDAEVRLTLAQWQAGASFDMETHKATLEQGKFDKVKFENIDKIDVVVESTQKIAESMSQQASQLSQAIANLGDAVKSLSKPKKVVRDKSGKIVSVTNAD